MIAELLKLVVGDIDLRLAGVVDRLGHLRPTRRRPGHADIVPKAPEAAWADHGNMALAVGTVALKAWLAQQIAPALEAFLELRTDRQRLLRLRKQIVVVEHGD